ncbi:MAG TPA: TetR/AcrR family transcriptional regulator [Spirochaetota bacterium]|nr:TetR/AcrR family transcriptional regulator [Spirochaetota bacterium]HNT11399.1 TetR/AcrR family transcriptional regulator [Spirochaetota bacterium]HNV46377.1 TetR/AcrR family transcriptional regulator [Spirochaetota bacterium]HOS39687.1 TetR/AcrR family transcriptional regulator [Spirochaetota bacterium]HPI22683.1 TetR/AcrR family transcriptional regulator [Spirochaetota bacterium]
MNKAERRELIIRHATTLFAEKGYYNVSVTDIIDECRIVRSTFYAHFRNKQDIFRLLVDRFSDILQEAILGINISKADRRDDLVGAIREMSLALVDAIERNRDLTTILVTAPLGHDDDFDDKVNEFYAKILGAIKLLLAEGMRDGTIARLDADIISYAILGNIKQIVLQWIIYRDVPDIRTALDDIVRFILFGITRR